MFQKKNNGITLVSLVITIILLILLAGISIAELTGNGLFARAIEARDKAEIARLEEELQLAITETIANKGGNSITLEDYMGTLTRKESLNITSYSYEEDGKQVIIIDDKYVFEITDDNGKIIVEAIGKKDKLPPKITLANITNTTNSITVEVTTERNEGGKIEYYIKGEDEEEYTLKETTTETSYTYTGLEHNKKYNVKIVAIAKNKETAEILVDRTLGSVPAGTGVITFSTETWTDGKASITISTETSYTIQYQVNSLSESGWTKGTSVTELSHGDIVYARLWDGRNGGIAAAQNILDGTEPSASISLSAINTTPSASITATVTHSDSESGVNITSCKWIYNTISSEIGTDSSSYIGTFSSNEQTITLSAPGSGTYYLHVLTTDVAGNVKETISSAITVYPTMASQVSVGDYVAYDATSNYSYTPPKGSGSSSGTGIEGTGEYVGTPGVGGATVANQTFTSSSNLKWRVLSTNSSTGEVILISEEPIKTDAGNNFYMHGAIGYLYAEEELNRICAIYGHGIGANTSKIFTCQNGDTVEGLSTVTLTGSGARSINVDDINNITGYIPTTGSSYTRSLIFPTKSTSTGYTSSSTSRKYTSTEYFYTASSYLTDTTSKIYKMLFRNTEDSSDISYFLSSRCVEAGPDYFFVRNVSKGQVAYILTFEGSTGRVYNYSPNYCVRPIVYLKSTVQTSGRDSSGAWTIIDK